MPMENPITRKPSPPQVPSPPLTRPGGGRIPGVSHAGERLRRWVRRLLTPVLMLAALGGGMALFVHLASLKRLPSQIEPAARVFRVPVFLVQRLDIRPLQTSFGTALPDRQVTVAAEVAGRIIETHGLRVGTALSGPPGPGEESSPAAAPPTPVIRIDPDTYRERLLQAEALLAQDAAELEQISQEVQNNRELLAQRRRTLASAEEQLKLQRRLQEQGAGRETELRRVEIEYQQYAEAVLQLETTLKLEEVRRKQVQARQAAHERDLALARLELQRSQVFAPFPGVVSRVMVEHGQYVRPGEPLFELTDLSRVEVPLAVPLSRSDDVVSLLAAGVQPRVQLAEHEAAHCRWVGRVTRMAPVADETTRTVRVYAEVDNTQTVDPLRPGTFVHARIELGEVGGILLVPRDAIVAGGVYVAATVPAPRNDGGGNWEEREGTTSELRNSGESAIAERREITVGGTLASFAIVTAGLSPGDRVVLTNLDVLRPGTLLSVVEVRDVQQELQRETLPLFEVVEATPLAVSPGERRP
jgi:RND family efflux transporter MFP subunit